jgi:HKD family nuclease
MKNNKVLFVTEKYCDANPSLGLTNNFHNLFNTFQKFCPDKQFHVLHLDEAEYIYGVHIDKVLPRYCKTHEIQLIIFSLLGASSCNPSHTCLKELKDLGVYSVVMWPDTGPGWGCQTIKELGDLINLHVSWDNPRSAFHDSNPFNNNHLQLWCPQDPNLFYKQKNQDLDVGFIGSSRYFDRHFFLKILAESNTQIIIRGGQREEKLSPEQYAEFMRRLKININFSLSPAGFFQTKGRIFEILACGGLLFESKNPATEQLLKPNEEYVDFNSPQELIDKIKFYTNNEEERLRIAENGWKIYHEKFHPRVFWGRIFERINKDLNV